MRLVGWLAATERVLDVVRIALDEARVAREQDAEPVIPPPPVAAANEGVHPPRFVLERGKSGYVKGVGRQDWDGRREQYTEVKSLEFPEIVAELNAYISDLKAYGHFDDF
jgi:hypothetical protein